MTQVDYLQAGLTNTFDFDCVVGTEYAIPSEDFQVLVSVDGVVTVGSILATQATSFSYGLPVVSVNRGEVSNLSILVKAKTSVGSFILRRNFKVIEAMDIPTDTFQVKRKLGLTDNDLTDAEIPLEACYLQSYKALSVAFHVARLTDPLKTDTYGRFLSLFCALRVLPALYLRLAKKDKTENAEFQRLADAKHLEDLRDLLIEELNDVIDELGVDLVGVETLLPTILTFVTITPDRITGV